MTAAVAVRKRTDALMGVLMVADLAAAVALFFIASSFAFYAIAAVVAGLALLSVTPRLWPRMQRWIHVAAVVTFLVGGGAVFWGLGVLNDAIDDAQVELDAVMLLLREGRTEDAYRELAEETRGRLTLAQFQQQFANFPPGLLEIRHQDVNGKSGNLRFGAASNLRYSADVEFADGSTARLDAEFFRHEGRWRPGSFNLSDIQRRGR